MLCSSMAFDRSAEILLKKSAAGSSYSNLANRFQTQPVGKILLHEFVISEATFYIFADPKAGNSNSLKRLRPLFDENGKSSYVLGVQNPV